MRSRFGQLFRTSRFAALPQPVRLPEMSSQLHPDSGASHPLHQVLTTPAAAHCRGDWGLKRNLPTIKSRNIRVSSVDTMEHQTVFNSANDHVMTLMRWREMGIPIGEPSVFTSKAQADFFASLEFDATVRRRPRHRYRAAVPLSLGVSKVQKTSNKCAGLSYILPGALQSTPKGASGNIKVIYPTIPGRDLSQNREGLIGVGGIVAKMQVKADSHYTTSTASKREKVELFVAKKALIQPDGAINLTVKYPDKSRGPWLTITDFRSPNYIKKEEKPKQKYIDELLSIFDTKKRSATLKGSNVPSKTLRKKYNEVDVNDTIV